MNSQHWCYMLMVDGIVKCNGHLTHFPVNRAFRIVQRQISWLLLYFIFLYHRCSTVAYIKVAISEAYDVMHPATVVLNWDWLSAGLGMWKVSMFVLIVYICHSVCVIFNL